VNKPVNKYPQAIFLVTEERSCPLYNIGDELKVENFSFSVSSYKSGCLYLSQEIIKILSSPDRLGGFSKFGTQKKRFDCGGCGGLIHFEYKKEKDYATVQMKLLNDAEDRRRQKHLDKFFGVLRKLELFESLDDDTLSDLTVLLDLKTIPVGKEVVKKGDPGSHLYIILKGEVAVLGDDNSLVAEMSDGEIFGEMSLLSGDPMPNGVHTRTVTQLAMLSVKNFKHVLTKFPVLQLFLFKLLVDRAQTMTLQSGNITSGMTGELSEIGIVDLLQLINSSQKTGTIDLTLELGRAMIFFKEGEIIYARFLKLRNRDAVFKLLSIKNGRFSYTKGIPPELDKLAPIGGFMGLMMEGIQKIDENNLPENHS
jgi:CRP-like cAMP-binding protein